MNVDEAINSAVKHLLKGELDQAEKICREISEIQPNNVFVLLSLGIIYFQFRKYDLAIQYTEQALQIDSNIPDAYNNLGNIYLAKGLLDEATGYYRKALQLDPNLAISLYNLGIIFQEKRQLDEAINYYHKALQLNPDYFKAYNNLGSALQEKGLPDEAISCYRKALQLKPDSVEVYNNLGNAFQEKGLPDEAISCYRKALQLNPDSVEAYNNLGSAFQEKGLLNEAIGCYHKALQLNKEYADAHWCLSHALLSSGHLKQGLQEYEWRWKIKDFIPYKRTFPQSEWDGSSLKGRKIFVYSEQGVGDEIMFASCLPEVIGQADSCLVDVDKRLVPLFARSFPKALVIERVAVANGNYPAQLAFTDVKVAIGSLPLFLRPNFSSFPQKPYLISDSQKVAFWRTRLEALGEGLKVGISWRGGSKPAVIRKRSTDLTKWSKLLSMRGVHFINLQYGECDVELRDVYEKDGVIIHNWKEIDPLKDLDSFAAQIAALDLVISVDNATVHLAGALGIPVWVLLPFACDWRWMREFEDTPWYPTVRLFRQDTIGDWEGVFERLFSTLKDAADAGDINMEHWRTTLDNSYRTLLK